MFSSGSFRSISLATVTPSLVIVGDPNFLSRTTLRPLGPSVTFTASASWLTPRRIAWRDCSPYTICFAIARCLLLVAGCYFLAFLASAPSITARTSSSRMMRYSSPSSLISWPEYLPNRMVSPALTSSAMRLPSSLTLPAPDGDDLALLRLFLGGVRDDDPADFLFAFLDALDNDAVVQRSDVHALYSVCREGLGPSGHPDMAPTAICGLALAIGDC